MSEEAEWRATALATLEAHRAAMANDVEFLAECAWDIAQDYEVANPMSKRPAILALKREYCEEAFGIEATEAAIQRQRPDA